jgi:4-alpha-glucanotransferase
VYRVGPGISPEQSVRDGARLYESPDLVEHPALARFALVRGDQIDRTRARHADGWVRELSVEQVEQYAIIFELVAAVATEFGLAIEDLSCEVLSTMPYPLGRVLARYGLGRWRITQKANLDDDTDVYRADAARPADWIMLGNHDTAPIRAVIAGWSSDKRTAWVRHLATTLQLSPAQRDDIAATDGMLATAMLAEAFACDAENVSIFWADLFGEVERFNAPGTVSDENWSLRLPADCDRLLDERLARREALDIPLALAMALGARGSRSGVAAALLAAR